MKIRVQFTLDVDPDRWAEEYALRADEVRADVQSQMESLARDAVREIGALK